MSFLLGKQKQLPNANEATVGAHGNLLQFLQSQGGGLGGLFPGTSTGNVDIQPYLDLFTMQNARNLAQAKESAGNLTGSGLATSIGQEAGRASTEQGAFLANLFEARRMGDANRRAQLLLGALGSPAGSVTNAYQPGALDYLFQGASAAAPFFLGPAGAAVTAGSMIGNRALAGQPGYSEAGARTAHP